MRSLIEAFLQREEAASKYPQPDLLQGYVARRHSFIDGHVSQYEWEAADDSPDPLCVFLIYRSSLPTERR